MIGRVRSHISKVLLKSVIPVIFFSVTRQDKKYFTKLKKLIKKNQLYDNMHIVLLKIRLHKYGIIQVYKDGKKLRSKIVNIKL